MNKEIKEILEYLRKLQRGNKAIRIEAEMKIKKFDSFFEEYKATAKDERSKEEIKEDKSITLLDDNSNKWGVELRLYYQNGDKPAALKHISVAPRKDRQDPYTNRINNNNIIQELFRHGFKLGDN